jgi:hypothetical protein
VVLLLPVVDFSQILWRVLNEDPSCKANCKNVEGIKSITEVPAIYFTRMSLQK